MSERTSTFTPAVSVVVWTLVLGALLVVAGCAGMSGAMHERELKVTLTDDGIALDPRSVMEGEIAGHVVNEGSRARELLIAPRGASTVGRRTGVLAPGDATDFRLPLSAGDYVLYTEAQGTRERQMRVTLSVEEAGTASPYSAYSEDGGGGGGGGY
jgi:hypothetical protein